MTERLAIAATALKPRYDAIVVGSGYGGGVAACRLARMGVEVAVLERGRERLPGEFPSTVMEASRELQVRGKSANFGSESALFDVRLGNDIHVLMACGLGGTSLINANVCLAPDTRVFDDPVWPHAIRSDRMLAEGFLRARHMLRPLADPGTASYQKVKALQVAASALGATVEPVPLHIAFSAGHNAAGIRQTACAGCGDCCGGCNVGSKTTVANTYLADARAHGAEIFTEARVRSVSKCADGGWRIALQRPAGARAGWTDATVEAGIVVLAAGTLGTTEILLRSKALGLALSDRLGEGVTSNGDAIAIAYNNDIPVNGVGVGVPPRADVDRVGAAVNGLVDLRRDRALGDGLAIVECALPSSLAPLLPGMLVPGGAIFGHDRERSLTDEIQEMGRAAGSLFGGAYAGAVHNTQTFLAVGHDEGNGRLRLDGDRLEFDWPGVTQQAVFRRIEETLQTAAAATGGTYMKNPASERIMGGNLMTVHPLGGCRIGADRTLGVVSERCAVFDAAAPTAEAVHAGLYAMDGSVIPRSLGVHPLLTITAVAERAMLLFAADHRLTISDAPAPRQADAPRPDAASQKSPPPTPRQGFWARITGRRD